MNKAEVDIIISKFLDNETTEQENILLLEWIQIPDNRIYLEEFIRTEIWIKYSLNSSQVEKQLSKLSIYPEQKRKPRFNHLALAAVFVLALGVATFLYFQPRSEPIQQVDANAITLEINRGKSSENYVLENGTDFSSVNKSAELVKNELIDYSSKASAFKKANRIEFHTVHVPYGKTFKVKLEDGSLVHLNSGSRLTYPSHFKGLNVREVSLVGEAYFKVTKDTVPFQVITNGLLTRVLGTEFNVSAYGDEKLREVILVEGAVEVSKNDDESKDKVSRIMKPNQRAVMYKTRESLSITAINPEEYITWTKGELVFYNESIDQIIKKLERKFNIDIQNKYVELETLRFNGRFKDENITAVLETIKAHTDFSYLKEGNTITIKEP